MNEHDEFLKAYSDYPTQDNEGFVPNRAGFKCGFSAAWGVRQIEIDTLRTENERLNQYWKVHRSRWDEMQEKLTIAEGFIQHVAMFSKCVDTREEAKEVLDKIKGEET